MTHQNKEGLEALLPCPFCGSEPHVTTYETESLWSHNQVTYTKVECPECEIAFHSEPGYELEAPDAWNRRAPDATSQAQLKIYSETIEFVRRWAIDKEGNGTSAEERLSAIAHHPGVARSSLSQNQEQSQ